MSDSQIRTIERFFEMIGQPGLTAALNTALRLGVVGALEQGQKTASEIAEQCGIHEAGARALLQVLIATGMVEQFEDHYALSQASRLTPQTLWAIMFDQWTSLESSLKRTGSGDQPEADQHAEHHREKEKRLDQFRALHSQFQWAATGAALKVNEALGIGTERQSLKILDPGCGSAVFSMAIAHHDSGSTVHLVDDAPGLRRARATVDSLEIADRVEWTESSELVFPGNNDTFDLVVIADRIHLWSPEVRQRILATALRTLKPGGEIAIIDVFAGQPRGNLQCSLFELQLLIGTGQHLVTLEELKDLLSSTGFTRIQYTDLPIAPYTHGLVLAARDID